MEKASKVFSIIGIICSIIAVPCVFVTINDSIGDLHYEIYGYHGEYDGFLWAAGIFSVFCLIFGIAVSILTIKSINDYDKKIYLGVLSIIFVNVFAGVFYLCWHPYYRSYTYRPIRKSEEERKDSYYNDTRW